MPRFRGRRTLAGPDPRRRAGRTPSVLFSSWTTALLILVTLLSSFGSLPQPAQAAAPPRVLPQLAHEASGKPEQTFRIIVQRRNQDRRADAAVTTRGFQKLTEVAGDGFVALVPGHAIAALGQHPAVKYSFMYWPQM